MALRNIRLETDPILRKQSKEIKEITDRIKEIAMDMKETMYHANGVGLAAPQVGILKRLIVVDITPEGNDPRFFINPVITSQEGCIRDTEGCLSVPGIVGFVNRPEKIRVKAIDLDGNEIDMEAEGFFARAICHEVDHLNGIVFIDREDYEKAELKEDDEESEE